MSNNVNTSILKSTQTLCRTVSNCKSVNRVICAMKYYQSLDIKQKNNEDQLVQFCCQTYKACLDDYIHTISHHNSQINEIFQMIFTDSDIIKCNVLNCPATLRHYRDRNDDKKQKHSDKTFVFYRDLMDCMHFYLFHSYDVGLRVNLQNDDEQKAQFNDSEMNNSKLVDESFSKLCKIIKTKRDQVAQLNRVDDRFGQNKFNLVSNKHEKSDVTFMDGLYQSLREIRDIIPRKIKQVKQTLDQEEYESDSIMQDIIWNNNDDKENSNVELFAPQIYQSMKRYIAHYKLYANVFSIGFRFYYWNHYKTSKEEIQSIDNINDHSGYQPHKLFVGKKYSSLRVEILNNKLYCLDITDFNASVQKANHFIGTAKVKRCIITGSIKYLIYNLKKGTALSFNNLMAIILYCDWTDLCATFSATFRAKNSFENILS
eukprot:353548_1